MVSVIGGLELNTLYSLVTLRFLGMEHLTPLKHSWSVPIV